jgi:hypothetical protein
MEIPGAEQHPAYLAVASWATFGAAMRQDFARATELAARIEAIQHRRVRRDPAAYQGLATLAFFQGDLPRAHALGRDWVAAARDNDDQYALAYALILLGSTYQFADPEARARFEEAVRVARDVGNLSALSLGLSQLVNLLEGNEADARLALADEALTVATELGDRIAASLAASARLWALAGLGDYARTLALARHAAEQMDVAKSYSMLTPVLTAAGVSLAHLGKPRRAAILFGAADSHSIGEPPKWVGRLIDDARATVRAQLPSSDIATLEARGAALSRVEANAYLTRLERDDADV